jgi:hypothetical protein
LVILLLALQFLDGILEIVLQQDTIFIEEKHPKHKNSRNQYEFVSHWCGDSLVNLFPSTPKVGKHSFGFDLAKIEFSGRKTN